MTAREKVFTGIREALAPLKARAPHPGVAHGVADAQWLGEEKDLEALFVQRARAAGTVCFTSVGSCVEWLGGLGLNRIHVSSGFDELAGAAADIAEIVREYRREWVDEIDASFTAAAGAIAESGTIILTDESTPDRLAALAPWTHIAVVRRETIHRSVADALAAMPDDPNVIWITGPSKTADVEGILIQGVHGPGVQACLLV